MCCSNYTSQQNYLNAKSATRTLCALCARCVRAVSTPWERCMCDVCAPCARREHAAETSCKLLWRCGKWTLKWRYVHTVTATFDNLGILNVRSALTAFYNASPLGVTGATCKLTQLFINGVHSVIKQYLFDGLACLMFKTSTKFKWTTILQVKVIKVLGFRNMSDE